MKCKDIYKYDVFTKFLFNDIKGSDSLAQILVNICMDGEPKKKGTAL